jgi:F-type H+-transporting ATPase subunit delta
MALSRRLLAKHIATKLAAGEPRADVMKQLASYIVMHRLENDYERIINDIRVQLAQLGNASANVITATPLTDELRTQLEAYVKTMTDSQSVSLTEQIDPSIKGGIIIETPTKRYDASIATKLKQLRNVT